MKILVVHGWVTGNLGDVLQTSALVDHLRSLGPERLDLAGYPRTPAPACDPMLAPVDRFVPETAWFDDPPGGRARLRAVLRDARRFVARARWFRGYDVVVSAPGPFMASADLRHRMALLDVEIARVVRRPFVFASHSIGPLGPRALDRLRGASLVVAREPDTHDYLAQRGVRSIDSADFAFLFPPPGATPPASRAPARPPGEYRLAFLRSDNLELDGLRFEGGCLRLGARQLTSASSAPLLLASSDPHRDRAPLAALASRLPGVGLRICESVWELSDLIAGASEVFTDRYHPAVLAALHGRRVVLIETPGWQKMGGLQRLIESWPIERIQERARAGLEAITRVIRDAPRNALR